MELDAMWIAIAVGCISACVSVVVVAIRYGGKKDNPGNPGNAVCPAHSGLVSDIENTQKDVVEIKGDVKTIISTTGEIKGLVEAMNNRRRTD